MRLHQWMKSVIIIEGNNITVDFNNSVLKGSNAKKNPDEFFGVAILIKGGKNITIKNLKAKGYKVALLARMFRILQLIIVISAITTVSI